MTEDEELTVQSLGEMACELAEKAADAMDDRTPITVADLEPYITELQDLRDHINKTCGCFPSTETKKAPQSN